MAQKVEPQISEAMVNSRGEDIAEVYEFSRFLVSMTAKPQRASTGLMRRKHARAAPWRPATRR
jgi:hypothetical protein